MPRLHAFLVTAPTTQEVTMPRTRKDEAPAPVDAPFIHGRYAPETTARDLAGKLITFMETGAPPEGLFTPDVFCDFTMPQCRLQAQGVEDLVALRKAGHPGPSRVPRSRFDATATGFVLEVEEEWDSGGEPWYCRELLRADVSDGSVSQVSVYCTGDWDRERVRRHAETVHLIRH
jgi:hypothetical protein